MEWLPCEAVWGAKVTGDGSEGWIQKIYLSRDGDRERHGLTETEKF
jgi:hypothetical protein